jgi:hypothetical protein
MAVPSRSDYYTFRAIPFRSFLLFMHPTSIAKRKATAEKLLARAKSNGYERGAHREAMGRTFDTNANKLIRSRFQVRDGKAEAHPNLVSKLEGLQRSAAIASVPEVAPKILVASPPAPSQRCPERI